MKLGCPRLASLFLQVCFLPYLNCKRYIFTIKELVKSLKLYEFIYVKDIYIYIYTSVVPVLVKMLSLITL